MELGEIKFENLNRLPVRLNWGNDNFYQERFFYFDDEYVYKVWHKRYNAHRLEVAAGRYREYRFKNENSRIAAIDCGLVNNKTCPAFVDFIIDSENICRGYILKKGKQLLSNKDVSNEFVELIWQVTLDTGYGHTDLCSSNIVRIGNVCSLVDVDSNPTDISSLDLDFERSKGSLRSHVLPRYRTLLTSQVNFARQ